MNLKQTRERAKLVYKNNCRACQLSKTNVRFRRQVAHAKLFRQSGEDTLVEIAATHNLNQAKLYNHAAKHLSTYEHHLTKKQQAERQQELMRYIDDPDYPNKPEWEQALDEIIATYRQHLDTGKIKMVTASQFITASKIMLKK